MQVAQVGSSGKPTEVEMRCRHLLGSVLGIHTFLGRKGEAERVGITQRQKLSCHDTVSTEASANSAGSSKDR